MTNKRQREQYDQRTALKKANWRLDKSSRLHKADETARHAVCKTLVGHYLKQELGYKVAFEVECEQGELDVLGYGLEDRLSPVGVEVETGLTSDVKSKKLDQYYRGEPLQELYFIEVNDMPAEMMPAYEWVGGEI